MCPADLVLHFAPTGVFFWSVKQIGNAPGDTKQNEVRETEKRNQDTDFGGDVAKVIQ